MAATDKPQEPDGLGPRGRQLWKELNDATDLDTLQVQLATEACRLADRLEQLDEIIRGKGVLQLMHFRHMIDADTEDTRSVVMTVDAVLSEARQQQNVFKQVLASLRMPDSSGRRPQRRGGARGSYDKSGGQSAADQPGSNVTPLERARRAAAERG